MNLFSNQYWEFNQVLHWALFRDKAEMNFDFDPETRSERGFWVEHDFTNEDMPLDFREPSLETDRTFDSKIAVNLVLDKKEAIYPSTEDAIRAILDHLANGDFRAWGKENNLGNPREIPQVQLCDLKVRYDGPPIFVPKGGFSNSSSWHCLKFLGEEVRKIWPPETPEKPTKVTLVRDCLLSMYPDREPEGISHKVLHAKVIGCLKKKLNQDNFSVSDRTFRRGYEEAKYSWRS